MERHVLTTRALNRATLARQMLLVGRVSRRRSEAGAIGATALAWSIELGVAGAIGIHAALPFG